MPRSRKMPLTTLKKRSEFLRLRGGARAATPCFVLETKPRVLGPRESPTVSLARFGFTVTKALGNAVVRNRIRRRLKAAVAATAPVCALPGHDYILIARIGALDRPFEELKKDLELAFQRVRHPPGRRQGKPP